MKKYAVVLIVVTFLFNLHAQLLDIGSIKKEYNEFKITYDKEFHPKFLNDTIVAIIQAKYPELTSFNPQNTILQHLKFVENDKICVEFGAKRPLSKNDIHNIEYRYIWSLMNVNRQIDIGNSSDQVSVYVIPEITTPFYRLRKYIIENAHKKNNLDVNLTMLIVIKNGLVTSIEGICTSTL